MKATLFLYYHAHPMIDTLYDELSTVISTPLYKSDFKQLPQVLALMKSEQVSELDVHPLFFTDGITLSQARKLIDESFVHVHHCASVTSLPHFSDLLIQCFKVQTNDTIVVLAHGTRDMSAYEQLLEELKTKCADGCLMALHNQASLENTIKHLKEKTPQHVIIIPLFFTYGHHMKKDIPKMLAQIDPLCDYQYQPKGLCDYEIFRRYYLKSFC
ncbi:MAG: sirohydrochlorin cobaltochelatase [Erysipelotrichaceae bacterium]|nr:sirohydrochlorin cobaltochelatase [Erysipelotrichaceae bacterium]